MSTAQGQVKFSDGVILYTKYQGVSDCLWSKLFVVEPQDLAGLTFCICDNDEPVLLATDYGGGHHWHGRACRHCLVITQGCNAFRHEGLTGETIVLGPKGYTEGLPKWWKK